VVLEDCRGVTYEKTHKLEEAIKKASPKAGKSAYQFKETAMCCEDVFGEDGCYDIYDGVYAGSKSKEHRLAKPRSGKH
jgi:hypothetical protein